MPDRDQLTSQKRNRLYRALVHQVFSPLIGSAVAVAYATGRWDLSAVGTGLAMTGTLALFAWLDRIFIHPHLERIPQDWLRLEMDMFISVAEHLLGALLALVACGRIFGFEVAPTTSWLLLVGIMMVFPILHGTEMLSNWRKVADIDLGVQIVITGIAVRPTQRSRQADSQVTDPVLRADGRPSHELTDTAGC